MELYIREIFCFYSVRIVRVGLMGKVVRLTNINNF